MTLGIMQPYFFPYLGYYSLIEATDKWVVFDTVQYIRHGWINRNRILKPNLNEWQYIQVPLKKHSRNTDIQDIEVSLNEDWKLKILAQLEHYKRRAPNYSKVVGLVEECFAAKQTSITSLNVNILELTCQFLNINLDYQIYSEMDIQIEAVSHAGGWALNICKAMKANKYINPDGGRELFDLAQFREQDIDIQFLTNNLNEYNQKNTDFIKGLSIIDTLMYLTPQETLKLIRDYNIEE